MDWKMIILALFFARLDGQRTDCNPFQINRLESYHMIHICTFGPKKLRIWTKNIFLHFENGPIVKFNHVIITFGRKVSELKMQCNVKWVHLPESHFLYINHEFGVNDHHEDAPHFI